MTEKPKTRIGSNAVCLPGPSVPFCARVLCFTAPLRSRTRRWLSASHAPECPEPAATIRPGSSSLRLPNTTDLLSARSLYDTADGGKPVAMDVVYLVVGKMTGGRGGERAKPVWGRVFVSGSQRERLRRRRRIGQTPFLAYARELLAPAVSAATPRANEASSGSTGVRNASPRPIDDRGAAGVEIHMASDGQHRHEGLRDAVARIARKGAPVGCARSRCCTRCRNWPRSGAGVRCRWKRRWPAVGICFSWWRR